MSHGMKILPIFLVLVLFAGCTRGTTSFVEDATPIAITSLSPMKTNITTPLSTATGLIDNWESSKRCVPQYPPQPEGNRLEGVLVLRSLMRKGTSSTVTHQINQCGMPEFRLMDMP